MFHRSPKLLRHLLRLGLASFLLYLHFACTSLDFAVISEVKSGSITVTFFKDSIKPAKIETDLIIALKPESRASGEFVLRDVLMEYTLPRPQPSDPPVPIRFPIKSLRFPLEFEECKEPAKPCQFIQNGKSQAENTKEVKMVVVSESQGYFPPSNRDWKNACESLKRDKFLNLYVYIGPKSDDSVAYALPKNEFNLNCKGL